ncbi:DUF3794 domain-containing protein [Niallia oryzisoli]|uniref:DUF3794 domain-containing protein n=1 Tax=Niallia oryzisoli TaxID=1737571 RepID=A0ABZ2C8V7_9BACI
MPDIKKEKYIFDDYFDCEPEKQHHHKAKMVTKVPVVLAEVYIQKDMFHVTDFHDFVLEIKNIKKQLVITRCRLLLPTNKVFIKGFVRKNIQYASPINFEAEHNGDNRPPEQTLEQNTRGFEPFLTPIIDSNLKSHTEHIDFELITEIKEFISKPVLPKKNSRHEFDFLVPQPVPSGFLEKDEMLSSDLSQFHQNSDQFYNDLPYCELISSNIIEWDEAIFRDQREYRRNINIYSPSGQLICQEVPFQTIDDKMVIDFKIRILQNQNVSV